MTKLIFACDVSGLNVGQDLIRKTGLYVDVIKVGLEAMTAEDYNGVSLATYLRHFTMREMKKHVMWDMKLHDVKNTIVKATQNIVKLGSRFFTIHATVSDEALAAVAEAEGKHSMALAVTVLTDLDDPQSYSRFHASAPTAVRQFALNAWRMGIRGFVCSPQEARIIRDALPDAYIVTPGVRPLWAVAKDEQKRVTTPAQAKQFGADAIVVGRPISNPPEGYTPASAAQAIKEELGAA